MPQRIEPNSRTTLWIERIVWNAAAGAALAVMILVLLGSLRWLDQVAPHSLSEPPAVSGQRPPRASSSGADRPSEVARVNRPSG
jgi:hypothetical protein